jgi:hypothetical protein
VRIEKEEMPYDTFTREFLATLPAGHPAVVVSGYVALALAASPAAAPWSRTWR